MRICVKLFTHPLPPLTGYEFVVRISSMNNEYPAIIHFKKAVYQY
jgi:hypothetical protein